MTYPRTHFEIYPGSGGGLKLEVHTEQQPVKDRSYGEKSTEIHYFTDQVDILAFMTGLLEMPSAELVKLGELLVELGKEGI